MFAHFISHFLTRVWQKLILLRLYLIQLTHLYEFKDSNQTIKVDVDIINKS